MSVLMAGVWSGHAGARLLADLADATGLTSAYSTALRSLRPRGTGHDPGRIATDLAVMLADGGETITDLAVLRDQAEVFGPIASTPTAWRMLADVDERALASLRSARAQAREVAWLQAAGVVIAGRALNHVHDAGACLTDLRRPGYVARHAPIRVSDDTRSCRPEACLLGSVSEVLTVGDRSADPSTRPCLLAATRIPQRSRVLVNQRSSHGALRVCPCPDRRILESVASRAHSA
ncbi:hypothetical protein ACWGH4_02585 [Streptomyces sp. NPDC054847]